jgi:hypothetical protein
LAKSQTSGGGTNDITNNRARYIAEAINAADTQDIFTATSTGTYNGRITSNSGLPRYEFTGGENIVLTLNWSDNVWGGDDGCDFSIDGVEATSAETTDGTSTTRLTWNNAPLSPVQQGDELDLGAGAVEDSNQIANVQHTIILGLPVGIVGDTVTLQSCSELVSGTRTQWRIDIDSFIADGELNRGGPDPNKDFELKVTWDTAFNPNHVVFSVPAAAIAQGTTWAQLFSSLNGATEETGTRSLPGATANDRAELSWNGQYLTVTSTRIVSTGTATGTRNIIEVEFSN